MKRYSVGIYVYNDVEVLDFAGPYEVFSTSIDHVTNEKCFDVYLFSRNEKIIKAYNGLKVIVDYQFESTIDFDILIIPGGYEKNEVNDADVIKFIKDKSSKAMLTASVCTGAFILAKAGLLDNKSVTTHWADIDRLTSEYPNLQVKSNLRFIDQESIITSAGISAGIDMSLYIVKKFFGLPSAEKTARRMEYDWKKI